MKRKVDWEEEEPSEREDYSDEESDEDNLSQAVARKCASELLHSMATSKDILFWTPCGQLLRHQCLIPVTNISELVEYVLLPHNSDVVKARALNTFLDGLAELGVDKRLIKNRKTCDLLEKEKQYQDNEGFENNEEQSTDSEEDEETASENSQSLDTENNDLETKSNNENSDTESNTIIQRKNPNPCQQCEGSNVCHTVNMKCLKCFWHDNHETCPVYSHNIPMGRKHLIVEV